MRCLSWSQSNAMEEFYVSQSGADTNADPFIPSAAIHGAKYQWGRSVEAAIQAQDQKYHQGDFRMELYRCSYWFLVGYR